MSHARLFDRMLMWCPILELTLAPPHPPAPAGENAGCGPPSPLSGRGQAESTLPSPLWGRGGGGEGVPQRAIVKYYAGHHTKESAMKQKSSSRFTLQPLNFNLCFAASPIAATPHPA